MTLNNSLERELALAIELGRAAGRAAMRFYESPLDVQIKGEIAEPVTQADFAANDVIVPRLQREFPDDGLLSEESPDDLSRLDRRRVWMVDPLDGTQGFIDRNGDFAVQIGLCIDRVPALGVVYQPAPDVLHYATAGGGAWRQHANHASQKLQVSDISALNELRLAASRTHRSPRMTRVVQDLGFKSEVNRGSVGVKINLIVEQSCDLYLHLSARAKQWDTCAPEAILREAGGELTDIFGEKIIYNTADIWNRNGILATNKACHHKVVTHLAPLLREFSRTV